MEKWIWEKLSKLYKELANNNFNWSSLDPKAVLIILLALIGLGVWKRKIWLTPVLKWLSYFNKNSGRENQLRAANKQLISIYEQTLSAYDKLQKNQVDFSSSVDSVRMTLGSISKADESKFGTTLVKAKKQINNDVKTMSEIYLESLSDLNINLKIMRENIDRAKRMDITRETTISKAMDKYPGK
jgi:hypothetical protein